jgi:hypothetical protein
MNNAELWSRISRLEGKTVWVPLHRALHVEKVSEEAVSVRSTRRRHQVPRRVLEAAYALGRNSQALSPEEIARAQIGDYDPVCIVGILNAVGADRD